MLLCACRVFSRHAHLPGPLMPLLDELSLLLLLLAVFVVLLLVLLLVFDWEAAAAIVDWDAAFVGVVGPCGWSATFDEAAASDVAATFDEEVVVPAPVFDVDVFVFLCWDIGSEIWPGIKPAARWGSFLSSSSLKLNNGGNSRPFGNSFVPDDLNSSKNG